MGRLDKAFQYPPKPTAVELLREFVNVYEDASGDWSLNEWLAADAVWEEAKAFLEEIGA